MDNVNFGIYTPKGMGKYSLLAYQTSTVAHQIAKHQLDDICPLVDFIICELSQQLSAGARISTLPKTTHTKLTSVDCFSKSTFLLTQPIVSIQNDGKTCWGLLIAFSNTKSFSVARSLMIEECAHVLAIHIRRLKHIAGIRG